MEEANSSRRIRAVVYAPGALGREEGKTGNDLVIFRGGLRFEVLAVVDPSRAGSDACSVLGLGECGVPVVATLEEALKLNPEALIIGAATVGGRLPEGWRRDIIEALRRGVDVYNGLHEFLSSDPEAVEAAREGGARIFDVRKPDPSRLRIWSGDVLSTEAARILVAGTDCESGKNITTMKLYEALRSAGVRACMVGTGQTMILLGARGTVVDAVPADFAAGVVESHVVEAAREGCEAIVVEGQAAVSHPAYGHVTLAVLRGAAPTHIVLAHNPTRRLRAAFKQGIPLTEPEVELEYLTRLNPNPESKLLGVSLDTHELSSGEAARILGEWRARMGAPAFDPLRSGVPREVVEAVRKWVRV